MKPKTKFLVSLISAFYPFSFCYMPPCPEGMFCTQAFICENDLIIVHLIKQLSTAFLVKPTGALILIVGIFVTYYFLTYFALTIVFYLIDKLIKNQNQKSFIMMMKVWSTRKERIKLKENNNDS